MSPRCSALALGPGGPAPLPRRGCPGPPSYRKSSWPPRPQGSPDRPRAPQFPHRRAGRPAAPCMPPAPGPLPGPRWPPRFPLFPARAAASSPRSAPPSGPSARLFTRPPARSSVFVFLLLLRTRSLNPGHSLKNDPVPQSFKTHPPLRFPPAILVFLPQEAPSSLSSSSG